MGSKVLYGSVKLKGNLASGTGDPVLTRDATTSEVGTTTNTIGTLTDSHIFVGNASNLPTDVAVTGAISISNTGFVAISSGVIVNDDINASAAIAVSKLAALTASRAVVTDASGFISASSVTSTELGYVSGVTSAIQTQINAKQATITGAATTITSSDLTANRAVVSNASGKIAISSVTDTELGYLSGVTSAVQTQLDAKFAATLTSVAEGDIVYYNGTNWVNLARGSTGQALYSTSTTIQWDTPTINGIPVGGSDGQVLTKLSGTDFDADWETLTVSSITDLTASADELNILDGATATTEEINFLSGASANIQTQLNNKLSTSLTTDSILVGVAGVATATTNLPTGTTIGSAVIYRVGGTDVTLADGGTGASLADPGADRIMFWDDSTGQVTWLEAGSGLSISSTTITATAVGLTDGDKGDITLSSTGTVWTIDNDAVTYAKMQNVSDASKLLGRGDSGSGDVQEITLGSGLTMTGTTLSASGGVSGLTTNRIPYATSATTIGDDSALTWDATNNALTISNILIHSKGNGTGNSTFIGSSAGNFTATNGDNTAIGSSAGGALTSGGGNTFLGASAGNNVTTGGNNVIIGKDVQAPSATASNQLSIQNIIFGTSNSGTGTTISTGNIGIGEPAPSAKLHVTEDTLGAEVFRISSPATNDDPTVSYFQNRVATTNDTLTTLHTITTTSDTNITFIGYVLARRTGGTAGTAGDIASYEIKTNYKNVGGTLTLIGGSVSLIGESVAGYDCQLNISSSNILIQVQGVVDTNITWHLSELKVMTLGS
jgi:hypothetical protein